MRFQTEHAYVDVEPKEGNRVLVGIMRRDKDNMRDRRTVEMNKVEAEAMIAAIKAALTKK